MRLRTTLLLSALAVATGVPARAFDVAKYRLVDLTHAYDSQTLYWPSRPPMKFELERLAHGDTKRDSRSSRCR